MNSPSHKIFVSGSGTTFRHGNGDEHRKTDIRDGIKGEKHSKQCREFIQPRLTAFLPTKEPEDSRASSSTPRGTWSTS